MKKNNIFMLVYKNMISRHSEDERGKVIDMYKEMLDDASGDDYIRLERLVRELESGSDKCYDAWYIDNSLERIKHDLENGVFVYDEDNVDVCKEHLVDGQPMWYAVYEQTNPDKPTQVLGLVVELGSCDSVVYDRQGNRAKIYYFED